MLYYDISLKIADKIMPLIILFIQTFSKEEQMLILMSALFIKFDKSEKKWYNNSVNIIKYKENLTKSKKSCKKITKKLIF